MVILGDRKIQYGTNSAFEDLDPQFANNVRTKWSTTGQNWLTQVNYQTACTCSGTSTDVMLKNEWKHAHKYSWQVLQRLYVDCACVCDVVGKKSLDSLHCGLTQLPLPGIFAEFESMKGCRMKFMVMVFLWFPCIGVLLGPHYHYSISTFRTSLPQNQPCLHLKAYSQDVNRWEHAEWCIFFEFVAILHASVLHMVRLSLLHGFACGWVYTTV